MSLFDTEIQRLVDGLAAGNVIPYLSAGLLELGQATVPCNQVALAGFLAAKTSVPFKLWTNLTAAAQYVENFKHRKTLTKLMSEAFANSTNPTSLHYSVVERNLCPLIVDVWYDDAIQRALAGRLNWGQVQGVSRAEHPGQWYRWLRADGSVATDEEAAGWDTLLYKPIGSIAPEGNFVVSDSDFVELLTEIDIQTPIPPAVQQRRTGRHFLFMGCRFNTQIDRIFARQIMKRSSDLHWAVMLEEPTRNELRFLREQNIQRIEMPLADFAAAIQLSGASQARAAS